MPESDRADQLTCFELRAAYARRMVLNLVAEKCQAMSKDKALIRQWLILKMLSARRYGVTVQEMAQELEVNQKTIRRDLDTFKAVGMPIEEVVGDHGQKRWSIKHNNGQVELSFSMDEALAFYLGRRYLEPMAGTLFWVAAQNAFKKIRACLGKPALDHLEKMAGTMHHTAVGTSDYSQKADLIDELMEGIEKHRVTLINYQSLGATEPVEYEIHPYGITYHRGSLYLVARSTDHDKLLHFKVDRIDQADVQSLVFEPVDGFTLEDHFANSFGVFQGDGDIAVTIRFLPRVVRYVEESKWHASQKLSRQRDGSLIAEFHLSSTEEIMRWVLSFGQNAIVLEPTELRDQIAAEIAVMNEVYEQPGGDGFLFENRRQIK